MVHVLRGIQMPTFQSPCKGFRVAGRWQVTRQGHGRVHTWNTGPAHVALYTLSHRPMSRMSGSCTWLASSWPMMLKPCPCWPLTPSRAGHPPGKTSRAPPSWPTLYQDPQSPCSLYPLCTWHLLPPSTAGSFREQGLPGVLLACGALIPKKPLIIHSVAHPSHSCHHQGEPRTAVLDTS